MNFIEDDTSFVSDLDTFRDFLHNNNNNDGSCQCQNNRSNPPWPHQTRQRPSPTSTRQTVEKRCQFHQHFTQAFFVR